MRRKLLSMEMTKMSNHPRARRTPRSPAFKKKVALEALKEDKTLAQLASQYGVHPLQVGQWKKALIDGAEQIFERKGSRKQSEDVGREELERKIGQLTVELDFLKKKLGC
jgi:transposase